MHLTNTERLLDMLWRAAVQDRELRKAQLGVAYAVLQHDAIMERFADYDKYVHRLEESGLIVERVFGHNSRRLFITHKGLLKIVEMCIRRKVRNQKSDNRLCILSIDIPEKFSTQRRSLNTLLKRLGFTRVHKTTWTGDIRLRTHAQFLFASLGYSSYVRVYIGRDVTSAESV